MYVCVGWCNGSGRTIPCTNFTSTSHLLYSPSYIFIFLHFSYLFVCIKCNIYFFPRAFYKLVTWKEKIWKEQLCIARCAITFGSNKKNQPPNFLRFSVPKYDLCWELPRFHLLISFIHMCVCFNIQFLIDKGLVICSI